MSYYPAPQISQDKVKKWSWILTYTQLTHMEATGPGHMKYKKLVIKSPFCA